MQSARRGGLTWNGVKWAFTSTDSYYHPLRATIPCSGLPDIWGRNAAGHHLTGVVACTRLTRLWHSGFLWTLLGATALTTGERLTVALWSCARVRDSSATSRIGGVDFRAGRNYYVRRLELGVCGLYAAGARRWVVWGLYVAALLCKPMAVSLPFVMLAIDYYPLRRSEQLGWGRLLQEKALWIAIGAVSSLSAVFTKSQVHRSSRLWRKPPSCNARYSCSRAWYSIRGNWFGRPACHHPFYPVIFQNRFLPIQRECCRSSWLW